MNWWIFLLGFLVGGAIGALIAVCIILFYVAKSFGRSF